MTRRAAKLGELVAEAVASARAQPVASTLTILVIIGMMLTVMLTTGRTVAAEREVLGSLDSAGTRSIVIRAETAAGVTSEVLSRIRGIEGIEWSGAFSAALDATNTLIPDGPRLPVRYAYVSDLERLGIPLVSSVPGGLAYASPFALRQLGMLVPSGSITLAAGGEYAMAGQVQTPEFLSQLEPLIIVPMDQAVSQNPVNLIVIVASRPDQVASVADAVTSVLAAVDPLKVTVQTSERLAELRATIEGQLGGASRGLVLALIALTGILVGVILYGLVMMRRRDFGRRRALGATRGFIVALLLIQTALLAISGVVGGSLAACALLLATGDPLPGIEFTVALGVLAVVVAVSAALIPAFVASRREPIRELRVP